LGEKECLVGENNAICKAHHLHSGLVLRVRGPKNARHGQPTLQVLKVEVVATTSVFSRTGSYRLLLTWMRSRPALYFNELELPACLGS